jgi:hypothetical protein
MLRCKNFSICLLELMMVHLRQQDFPCSLENDGESKGRKRTIIPLQFLDFSHPQHVGAILSRVASERIMILFSVHLIVNVCPCILLPKLDGLHLGAIIGGSRGLRNSKEKQCSATW